MYILWIYRKFENKSLDTNRLQNHPAAPIACTPPLAPINANFSWENIYYTIDQKQSN